MKKRFLYSFLFVVILTVTVFVLTRSANPGKQTTYSELLPRKSALTYAAEWTTVKNNVDVLTRKIKENPSDMKSLLTLAALFIQEARNTGNFSYYNEAAFKCINTVLERDAKNFEALTFKSTILLSQHRFADGLEIAKQVQRLYPYNAYVYGLMVDGYVELGKYKEAIEAADKMISLRPDNRSYSRIAYLREIHGDIPGAIEAMKMAVAAGAPGDENTEWCRVQLARLFEKIGSVNEAKMHYTIAINNRENYPSALAGLARIAAEEKNYDKALQMYMRADSTIPEHTFKEGLKEIYELTNQPEKATKIAEEILSYMKMFSPENKAQGQNEDHEMAHAYMGVNDYKKALQYALSEYERRPDNIEVNETVAIVYYGKGDYVNALPYIETALRTNCKNPELLCHAGLIYAKTGNKERSRMLLNEALNNNPIMNISLKQECRDVLKTLN